MSNMSYCRFQNTVKDLSDCLNRLEEMVDERQDYRDELSLEEYRAAQMMVQACELFIQYHEELEAITEELDELKEDEDEASE